MHIRRLLSKLLRLPRAEWADLVAAQGALAAAWLLVATTPRGRLVTVAGSSAAMASMPGKAARLRARGLAVAVNRAASYGVFRPQCLVRAVALKRLLDVEGLAGSRVQVGVRSSQGTFTAHAWVEYGSEVLGDRPEHVAMFAPLTDLSIVEAG